MWKFVPLFLTAIIMAPLAEAHSVKRVGVPCEERYVKKDRFFFILLAIGFTLFVGLRTRYNDTGTYRAGYAGISPSWSSFGKIDWALGSNPGFSVMNLILRLLGVSTQGFVMFYALVTVSCYVWFIRKYTVSVWQTIILYLVACDFHLALAAIKQSVAIAICLVATDRMLRKKWISFVLLVLLASTFHPYALMYLVTPFLCYAPWTRRSYLMMAVFLLLGIAFRPFVGTIVDITTMMGEDYTVESFTGAGVNFLRFIVGMVPIVLSFIVRKKMRLSENKPLNLAMNLTMLHGVILFVALFGTANYFARLGEYFSVFTSLSLPWLLRHFELKTRRVLTFAAFVLYSIFFCYDLSIHGAYDSVTLWEYLKIIFTGSG